MLLTLLSPQRWRHVVGTIAICLIVGFILFLIRGRQFGVSMLYAFTVGVPISACISLLQHGLAAILLRRRPGDVPLQHGWVGWPWMLPVIGLGSTAGYLIGLPLGDLFTGHRSAYPWQQGDLGALLTVAFVLLVSVLATAGFLSYFRLQELKVQQAEAQRQAAEARLTLLQSQLEPHMLFNTLAHLRVLIKLRPVEAQAMLDQLIAFLRATLQASRTQSHALADEFARLADYLALMQVRMQQRLQVELDLPPELACTPIPPLLLQPLVENAIKHGLEPHVDGGCLRVTAQAGSGQLVLTVSDSGVGARAGTDAPGTGFGLIQVRERLAQRYGPTARLELSMPPEGGCIATLTLPLP